MKIYDREKKKWVSQEAYEKSRNARDKKLCRGKRPHDFVLVLPDYVSYSANYNFKPEIYYEICDETQAFLGKQKERLIAMGIIPRYGIGGRKETRLYMCSVCKKRDYQFME